MNDIPLDPSSAQRRSLGTETVDFVDGWLTQRTGMPVSWPDPPEQLIEELLREPGEGGSELADLLETFGRAMETGFDTSSGALMSYIPNGGLYSAALGALIGSVTNRYTGASHACPGMTALEESVIRWMTRLFDLPESARGLLVSGGSTANQIAVVTARSRFGDDFRDGVIYTSRHVHHSTLKAARIAGISAKRIRLVDTDDRQRLDVRALEGCIADDKAQGLRPMMVVATGGTTDTGAIDRLAACADIAAAAGAWFHVDAAYGGFFQLTERGRTRLAGIERADSITVDAHKSLFLPFGVGGLLTRHPAEVIEAHEGAGAYMQDVESSDLPHYMEMGPEQTRPNRGIQVWLALNLHGVSQFRNELDRMLDLSESAARSLADIPEIELLGDPELSVVAFRAASGDDATRAIFDALIASREVHVSSTTIDGRFYIRLALLNPRTTSAMVERAVAIVAAAQ